MRKAAPVAKGEAAETPSAEAGSMGRMRGHGRRRGDGRHDDGHGRRNGRRNGDGRRNGRRHGGNEWDGRRHAAAVRAQPWVAWVGPRTNAVATCPLP